MKYVQWALMMIGLVGVTSVRGSAVQVAGTVTTSEGAPMANVSILVNGAASLVTSTSPTGQYTLSLAAGGSYRVTPQASGYTFSPVSLSLTNLTANQTGQNFMGTAALSYFWTGFDTAVYHGLQPLGGVVVNITGPVNATGVTGPNSGRCVFHFLAPNGGLGTYVVTPQRAGFTFSPSSLTYTNLTESQYYPVFHTVPTPTYTVRGQVTNFTHDPLVVSLYAINPSGYVQATRTNNLGNFQLTLAGGWGYTILPRSYDFTFSPIFARLDTLTADVSGVNFIGTPYPPYVSGTVTDRSGTPLTGTQILVTGSATLSATTSITGYRAVLTRGGSYTLTPQLTGYTFSPSSRSYTSLSLSQNNQHFTGVRNAVPPFELKVEPQSFNPQTSDLTASFYLDHPASIMVTIAQSSTTRVVYQSPLTLLQAGPNGLTWKGRESSGEVVAPGKYVLSVWESGLSVRGSSLLGSATFTVTSPFSKSTGVIGE